MLPLSFDYVIAESLSSGPNSRVEVADWLMRYLELKLMTVSAPAVVFDVDSTLLERDQYTLKRIDAIYNVFEFCQRKNISCHIVTARLDCDLGKQELSKVMKQMNMKLSKFHYTYMRPSDIEINTRGLEKFKTQCRQEISNRGYTIVANIGDNWHDLGYLSNSLKKLDETKSYIAFFPGHTTVSIKLPADKR